MHADAPDEAGGAPRPRGALPRGARRFRRGTEAAAFNRETEGFVPTDGLSWGAARHPLETPRLLTVDDPRAPNPRHFKGELYTPQKTLLAAMLALEQCPFLDVEAFDGCPAEWAARVQTRMGRISEKFSFGKTVLALALVCAQRVPALLPDQQLLVTCATHAARIARDHAPCSVFLPEVTVHYSRELPLTVVAAASSVISQWERETKRFTDLRYFIVENVHSLREFETQYRLGEAANLDLLFVKAGRVTSSFVVEGEPRLLSRAKSRSLFEALARILEGVPVARLIVDDYDTLKLGGDDCFLPAHFTWLLSATRRRAAIKVRRQRDVETVEEFFRQTLMAGFPILGAAADDVVNNVFSLHCSPEYVDAHINSTAVDFRRIVVRGGQAAVILRNLEVPEEVLEMVNADAVSTAAQALGIDARSIGDVIQRVVGVHLDKLRRAVRALVRTPRACATLTAKTGHEKDHEKIKKLWDALKDGADAEVTAALAAIAGPSPEVTASLRSLEVWAEGEREQHGKALNRMRDNIREGYCQCCKVPFEPKTKEGVAEVAYVLAGCCQLIVCEPCVTRAVGAARKTFITRCPNCASPLKNGAGLVRVGAELDLETALKDETVISAAEAPGGGLEVAPPSTDDPKLKAFIQFVRRGAAAAPALDCIRDDVVPPYIDGLLAGRRNAPWPAEKARKLLVFTMYAESTAALHNALERFGIPHCLLRGTRAQKNEAVRLLQEGVHINIMLVTAPKDCGGLNLPFLSHIVFYHRVLDRNVEAQVAARGQRLGRDHNLEIVSLLNESEAAPPS